MYGRSNFRVNFYVIPNVIKLNALMANYTIRVVLAFEEMIYLYRVWNVLKITFIDDIDNTKDTSWWQNQKYLYTEN